VYSPPRTLRDRRLREEQFEGNVFAIIIIRVALAVIFAYDQWKTWRRETAWRRRANHRGDSMER